MPLTPDKHNILLNIGNYSHHSKSLVLESLKSIDTCRSALYQGIERYISRHQQDIIRYAASKNPPILLSESDTTDSQYFRKLFIEQMIALNQNTEKRFNKDISLQERSLEKSAISMNELFGHRGVELYKKALEEEIYSEDYMDALFENSIRHYPGNELTRPMVMFIAGPSASGKSFVEKHIFLKALEIVPTHTDSSSGNDVLVIDGGIARETSQIRKLAIQVALNKGYTGLLDLHEASKILKKTKNRLYHIALDLYKNKSNSLKINLVIPETFATFGWHGKKQNLLKILVKSPNIATVFARVTGAEEGSFRETVSVMGEKRAFSVRQGADANNNQLDLNKTQLPESKAYSSKGFGFGVSGSKNAEKWYLRNSNDKIVLQIINDLRLYKPLPESNQWILAKKGEPKAVLCSQRVFDTWSTLSDSEKQKTPLSQYNNPNIGPQIVQVAANIGNKFNLLSLLTGNNSCLQSVDALEPSATSLDYSEFDELSIDATTYYKRRLQDNSTPTSSTDNDSDRDSTNDLSGKIG